MASDELVRPWIHLEVGGLNLELEIGTEIGEIGPRSRIKIHDRTLSLNTFPDFNESNPMIYNCEDNY